MDLIRSLIYSTDARIVFALWVGIAVFIIALVMMVAILIMRQWAKRMEARHLRIATMWKQILLDTANGKKVDPVPSLSRWQVSGFVDAWNEVHDILGVVKHPAFGDIARAIDLERRLYMHLDHGSFHDRVMAIIAMGHLGSDTHFSKLVQSLDDPSPIISLTAARAMLRIDPDRAVDSVVPQILTRPDWIAGGVATILDEAGPGAVSNQLKAQALRVNDELAPRMLRFLGDISPEDAAPVIRDLLSGEHDDQLVSTCLQMLSEPGDLHLVRPLLTHPRWHVRMHSASAIGRLGNRQDEVTLLPLLGDAQWWVRYRAAQALSTLLNRDAVALTGIRDKQDDRFAKDIIDHVMAEVALGVRA